MTNLLFDIAPMPTPDIEGLQYIADFISQDEEAELINAIDKNTWLHDLKRRVQHYGYKYDYKARGITPDCYIGPLPNWIEQIAHKLHQYGLFKATPDQVIVNEYIPGQGISAHIDCIPCFDDVIASLSLGSAAVMQFEHTQQNQKHEIYLQPRSLIVLQGAARYKWTHAIPARKSDKVDGLKIDRGRRLSLTFRKIITSNTQ